MQKMPMKRPVVVGFLLGLWVFLPLSPAFPAPAGRENAKKGVVKITVHKPNDRVETGAGIVVAAAQDTVYVLTALHVIFNIELDDASTLEQSRIEVSFFTAPQLPFPGRLFPAFDEDLDLAVVAVNVQGVSGIDFQPKLRLADAAKVRELEQIVALGHPSANNWQLSAGNLGKIESLQVLFSGDAVYPGNSGGALLDNNLNLLGVVTRRSAETGYAVRISVALDKLSEWHVPVQLRAAGGGRKWLYVGGGAALLAGGALAIFSGGSRSPAGPADKFTPPPGRPPGGN